MAARAKKQDGEGAEAKVRSALRTEKPKRKRATPKAAKPPRWRRVWRWSLRGLIAIVVVFVGWVAVLSVVTPPRTPYMIEEAHRLGSIEATWVPIGEIAPVMARSVVAGEDANFCLHWGFDMAALREAIAEGGKRGASTIDQQVVKNVFLWQGRSYVRKALEAAITPVVEVFWSKRRIIEVYLNVAEFDTGVFGVGAAAKHYFGVDAAKLSAEQAALLAAVLPNPKERSASKPSAFVRTRAAAIRDGAATIEADGRASCFEH
jgi:monofunctional biosynthetic peptidoglycan transglycosylase